MKRHELTDEQWQLVQPALPARTATTGRPPRDPRAMVNGILWILRAGAPWRDLPERFGPWQTVYDHFRKWRGDGTFDRILRALRIRLDRAGRIDWDLWCLDGSSVRASRGRHGSLCSWLSSSCKENGPESPPGAGYRQPDDRHRRAEGLFN